MRRNNKYDHTLLIVATAGGERAQLMRRFYIGNQQILDMLKPITLDFHLHCSATIEQPRRCSVYLINDGFTVNGSSVTVEFRGTSDVVRFSCFLDNQDYTPCKSTLLPRYIDFSCCSDYSIQTCVLVMVCFFTVYIQAGVQPPFIT